MADRLDAAQRLAEATVAVEHTQTYVRACQALGYANPELTSRPSQIREWFGSEGGLDLLALDRDCAELRAAGDTIAEALSIQRAQAAQLAAAWTGPGGEAADRFLQRHCDTANMVATEVRAAAQRCESLRDNLWYLLDAKVATTIAIDDRTQAQRAVWLAAAAEVTSGTAPGSTAGQVVGQQVMPYVDNDIRNDWLEAMRSSQANFATSYDMVIDRMAAVPAVHFESPGDLGPGLPLLPASPEVPAASREVPAVTPEVPAVTPAVAPAAAPAVPPAAASEPTSVPVNPVAGQGSTAPAPAPAPVAMPAAPAPDMGSALGDTSALPAGAGGLGGLGDMGAGSGLGGLGGLAGRIVDAMTGLLGSAADGRSDPSGLDDSSDGKDPFDDTTADDDPFHPDDEHDEDVHEGADDAQEARPVDGPPPADVPPPVDAPATPVDMPPPPDGAALDVPSPAAAPAGEPAPPVSGSTPCEIAAEQLPQAGQ